MKTKLLFATLLLAVFTVPVHAMPASTLAKACETFVDGDITKAENAVDIGFCLGFITGWTTGTNGMAQVEDDDVYIVRFKKDLTPQQAIAAFAVYINAHPELEKADVEDVLIKDFFDAKIMGLEKTKALPKATEQ